MCGICGFAGQADTALLKRMAAALSHRGPDEDGFYSGERISLGMRRLSIIDLETGHQPVHNENETIQAVFNGEIYNFKELRKELLGKGHHFYTDHSDSEVIVHLYEDEGIEFAHRLNGMFAIALWDERGSKLVLIRDRMGVKPLFYSHVKGQLVFASEIKSILLHPEIKREANYEALYHYFTFKNVPAPLTAFEQIFSLLPGEILEFAGGKARTRRWWKVHFREDRDCEEKEAREKILELLEDATRLRMISDVPFGAYLSGGVDSSAIVALMTRFADRPVKTFSLGYENELKNKEADLYHARRVSKAYGTEHHEYIMSCRELIDDVGDVLGAFDQPFSGTISTYFLTKLIRRHVKVALSGDAGDELFGSYLSHRAAQPMYHFNRLREKARAGTLTDGEKKLLEPCDLAFLEQLHERSGGDEAAWRYCLYLFSDEEKEELLSPEFKKRMGTGTRTFDMVRGYFKGLTSRDPLNRILEMEWNTQLPDQVLAFVDFLSMAHSVEIRSPFLDYRLVEYAATIPGNMKIRNGVVKNILKESVEPILPAGITARKKEGFVLPVFDWLEDELKDYCTGMLSEERVRRHGLLAPGYVTNIVRSYYSGKRELAARVWNLAMFQAWWEKYFG